jgi:hypothetical protein
MTADDTARQTGPSGGWTALILLGALGSVFALPRVQAEPGLQWAFGGAIALLGGWCLALRARGRALPVQLWLRTPHYVQAGVQAGVYLYWALYWPQVQSQLPLILAQIPLVMLLEACVSWTKGRDYRLGFSAVPIVGSTNLFLWFRDPVFAWQLVIIAGAWASKEFVKWRRAGFDGQIRETHIFNPSAIVLALAGLAMIITQTAHHSWAAEISTTLGNPPGAYENIFLMGLIVLSFVPSVLITLSATLTRLGLGWIFLQLNGWYRFLDTGIPIAVWLGMTLLATDPASTPRRGLGKVIFGVLYAGSVFVLYGVLKGLERPPSPGDAGLHVTYFDKLLFLPVLNLSVRWIDALAGWLQPRLSALWPAVLRHPKLHLAAWMGVFLLVRPQLVDHPGRTVEFWEGACTTPGSIPCDFLHLRYDDDCDRLQIAEACVNSAAMETDRGRAKQRYMQACDLKSGLACLQVARLSTDVNEQKVVSRTACQLGEKDACAGLGQLALRALQQGDPRAAIPDLKQVCDAGIAEACANLSLAYGRGMGVKRDFQEANRLRQKACDLGFTRACAGRR